MFRPLVLSILTVALCVPLASAGQASAADGPHVAAPSSPACVDLTLVKTGSTEPRADLYVAGSEALQPPPADPSIHDLIGYLDDVRAGVIAYLQEEPLDRTAVQVELVVPADVNSDGGYRFTLMADASACVPV